MIGTLREMKQVEVFTDGACKGNPGPGGWGALLRMGSHEKELSGGESDTTNNRMEMTAAIKALAALIEPCAVDLYSDSNYLVEGMTHWIHGWQKRGWKTANKKPVLNEDLWRELLEVSSRHEVNWRWVRGHNGHPENERVDQLASAEAEAVARAEAERDC